MLRQIYILISADTDEMQMWDVFNHCSAERLLWDALRSAQAYI